MTTRPSTVPAIGPREIYLDNNATTRPLPEVVDAMAAVLTSGFGNPSSIHTAGERARSALRVAREQVGTLLGAAPEEVVFTGGATEANNLVLQNLLGGAFDGFALVTTTVEHSSILAVAEYLRERGVDVRILPVGPDGLVDPPVLASAIIPERTVVSIQWANNETGVIQPLGELAKTAADQGAVFHTDAVQAAGKVPIDLRSLPIDLLTLSGHKLHGPPGVGAIVGRGVSALRPLSYGGSQERSLRPGTENVPAIVGLGVAFRNRVERFEEVTAHTARLRDVFETRLAGLGLIEAVNGGLAQRLPNTSNIRFSNVDGEALTVRLDQLGVRCSQSSACTNQRPEPSYVLRAMGLTEQQAFASVRFGFSAMNTDDDVDEVVHAIRALHSTLTQYAVA